MPSIRTILHPTDLSANSQPAFHMACSLARDYGAELVVLYVYPPPVNGAEAVDRARDNEFAEDLREKLHELVPSERGVVIDYRVAEGSAPAEAILDLAKNCDLVVMGSHGRTGLRRMLMGSVAETVLRGAECPVITVRAGMKTPASVDSGE
jgi:nucleotide-binding universal stress UspA family protein